MKLFLFERIEHASTNYHKEGGAVVIASDESTARALIASGDGEVIISDEEWSKAIVFELVGEHEPRVIAFPDAGCC
jgi:hypothetical protein